jgi:hypothetical protein
VEEIGGYQYERVYYLYALRVGAKLAIRRQMRQLGIDVNVSSNDSRNMCMLNSHVSARRDN